MAISTKQADCRRTFLGFFPGGLQDETYRSRERDYKWETHKRWLAVLGRAEFAALVHAGLGDLPEPAGLRRASPQRHPGPGPRHMIDIQSFIWVLGSAEYEQ